jgi:hypothetical protein
MIFLAKTLVCIIGLVAALVWLLIVFAIGAVICGPFTIIACPFLVASMFLGGQREPWKHKYKWIRMGVMPYVKAHALFCKLLGIEQQL